MMPFAAVFEIAPAKVLQGAVLLHGLASSPTPDTHVRVAWAEAAEGSASARSTRAGRSMRKRRRCWGMGVNVRPLGGFRQSLGTPADTRGGKCSLALESFCEVPPEPADRFGAALPGRAHHARADDHAVGDLPHFGRLLGRRDAEAHGDRDLRG